jgi:hypothetical protein
MKLFKWHWAEPGVHSQHVRISPVRPFCWNQNRMFVRHECLTLTRTFLALALVPLSAFCADFTFEIPPVPVPVDIDGKTITITVAGEVSGSPQMPGAGDQAFNLNLRADLGDLQSHLAPLLQGELNKSERCGDRLSIVDATLTPAAPSGELAIGVHFEKWICIKSLGEAAKKQAGGDATVHIILTPQLEDAPAPGQTVKLDADIGKVEAHGPLGELLRSGTVGAALRDKIREAMLKAVRTSANLEAVMPAQARRFVTIQTISFADGGFGRLAIDLAGQLRVPGEQVPAVLEEFGNR